MPYATSDEQPPHESCTSHLLYMLLLYIFADMCHVIPLQAVLRHAHLFIIWVYMTSLTPLLYMVWNFWQCIEYACPPSTASLASLLSTRCPYLLYVVWIVWQCIEYACPLSTEYLDSLLSSRHPCLYLQYSKRLISTILLMMHKACNGDKLPKGPKQP